MQEKILQTGNRYATVDVGSNSILLYVADKNEEGNFSRILDKSEITRLGDNLHETGFLSIDSVEKSIEVLKNYKKICDDYKVNMIAAAGTMALRNAKNSAEFIEKVKCETGIQIEIITGDEEARLSYLAVKAGLGIKEKTLIFDTGGGSTEFIYCDAIGVIKKFSTNIGAVRFTQKYLISDPVKSEELLYAENLINHEISSLNPDKNIKSLVGIGGTATNLAAVKHKMINYNPDVVQGTVITLDELQNQIMEFSLKTIEERRKISGLESKRADVILAGALIIKSVLIHSKMNSFTVSDYGVRHGLMFDRFG